MDILVNDMQVYCEIHNGYVESWEALYVKENNIREQRPARGTVQQPDEYGVCADCLAEEMHPLS